MRGRGFRQPGPAGPGGGVALNFESRGTTGPAIMFETSRGNAAIVDVYGGAVPYPVATSFAVEVYRILPNDTDFSPFRESGSFTGLNTAYIDGSAVYHTPEDKPSTMDLASLQQHGDNAVALARAFGSADIAGLARPGTSDDTYFPALGVLARYPGALVWPLAVLGVLAAVGLTFLARRRGLVSWPRAAAGLGLAVVPFVLAPVGAQLLWLGLVALRPGYANMIDPWWPGWFRACVVALVAAILLTWYALLRRRVGPWPLVHRRARPARRSRCAAGGGRTGRLLPGVAAGPCRGARRDGCRHGALVVGAADRGHARRRRRGGGAGADGIDVLPGAGPGDRRRRRVVFGDARTRAAAGHRVALPGRCRRAATRPAAGPKMLLRNRCRRGPGIGCGPRCRPWSRAG